MAYLKRSQYRPLPSAGPEVAHQPQTSRRHGWVSHLLCAVASVALTAIVMSTWMSIYWPKIQFKESPWPWCGHSAEEAISAGCIFDGMMNMWVTEDCYDKELTEEFMAIQDWVYYEDYNATIPITQEQLSRSTIAYGTWEWHEAHCFYSMLKLQRAIKFGLPIQKEVVSEDHTRHCKQVVNVTNYLYDKAARGGEVFDTKGMGTILHPGFPLCINSINLLPYAGVLLDG